MRRGDSASNVSTTPLYFCHAPLHGAGTGHPQAICTETPAPPDFPPHRYPHVVCGRCAERRGTCVSPGMQHASDFFIEPAPMGTLRTWNSAMHRDESSARPL